jgi:tetratricopeptide (TPR) repeat protein
VVAQAGKMTRSHGEGRIGTMKPLHGRSVLAISFVALAAGYGVAFLATTHLAPDAAWSRFSALNGVGYHGRALEHGDRALAMWNEADAPALPPRELFERRLTLADAHYAANDRPHAIHNYQIVLASAQASRLGLESKTEIRRRIAEMELKEENPVPAALIVATFLDQAGDAAASGDPADADEDSLGFLSLVDRFRPAFEDVVPANGGGVTMTGTEEELLEAATALTKLGGYYAIDRDGAYAGAGLLALAHGIRSQYLGIGHEDTVQVALLLAPIYERIDRLSDAEELYKGIFHGAERDKGPNNPDLSLYIRLLSGIYEKQGRLTEAEALNQHMRKLFRDAFGARRYAANRDRDRLFDVNRPVSAQFSLESAYIPPDLVPAESFGIPLSKNPDVEEMQLRLAKVDDTSMPEALSRLLVACESPSERLTLRSAYRSHATQVTLRRLNGEKGTVADPGTSEHQLGLAADIDVNGRFMRATDKAYACFETKAWQYGFILSFPAGNTYLPGADSFEPWHWRFVGPQTALLYREIGPWGKPQEFLAALPCYQERALSGLFLDRERGDVCLEGLTVAGRTGRDAG